VRRELRDIVLFASHSLLKDPPFSRIGLISCRNLLIYLDRELQQQALTALHYALVPGGFMLVGASETADNPPGLFRFLDRKARIYQTSAQPGDKPRLLPQLLAGVRPPDHGLGLPMAPGAAQSTAALHRQALEKVAPSILVDRTQHVVHLSETAGRYLQPSGEVQRSQYANEVRVSAERSRRRNSVGLNAGGIGS
jgi:two-component system CheB/CheR fusion protein